MRLVHNLKAVEIRFINDYYKARSQDNSKRPDLFNLIVDGTIKSNNDAIREIYSDRPNAASALSHLKKKLEEDILNVMLIISPDIEASLESNKEFQCKKKLLQCELLLARGLKTEGFTLLDKTSKIADKYEFPEINLASYNIKFTYNDKFKLQNCALHFENSLSNYRNLLKAKEAFFLGDESYIVTLPEKEISLNSSKKAHYWNELSIINNLCKQCKFKKAKLRSLNLKKFLNNGTFISSNEKEAKLNMILAEILLNLGEYTEALFFAKNATTKLLPFATNYQDSLLVLFFANLRIGHFQDAEIIYEQAIGHPTLHEAYKNKWILLKGALDFYQKKFRTVYRTVSKCDLKYFENPSWCLCPRFLELLSILELEDYEWYEYRLDCFRKKLSKFKIQIADRVKLVFSLLQSLVKANFNYDLLIIREQNNLNKLKNVIPQFNWNPMGYELINIPNWLLKKSSQFNNHSSDSL